MTRDKHNRVALAVEQLHVAIDLFLAKTSDASALTLAGAADEVLGRKAKRFGAKQAIETKHEVMTLLLQRSGRTPGSIAELRRQENSVRNALKHLDPDEEEDFEGDLSWESVQKIVSACNNYLQCGLPQTDKMSEFYAWWVSDAPR